MPYTVRVLPQNPSVNQPLEIHLLISGSSDGDSLAVQDAVYCISGPACIRFNTINKTVDRVDDYDPKATLVFKSTAGFTAHGEHVLEIKHVSSGEIVASLIVDVPRIVSAETETNATTTPAKKKQSSFQKWLNRIVGGATIIVVALIFIIVIGVIIGLPTWAIYSAATSSDTQSSLDSVPTGPANNGTLNNFGEMYISTPPTSR